MRKNEIAERIHQQTGISLVEAATSLDWILELIKKTLKTGESINISGFGKFTVHNKHARPGRNPRTGEAIEISPRRVVSFLASHQFRDYINSPSVAYKGFIIEPAPQRLADVGRWSLNLHISWSTKDKAETRHFSLLISTRLKRKPRRTALPMANWSSMARFLAYLLDEF